jgi:hypothetical protein
VPAKAMPWRSDSQTKAGARVKPAALAPFSARDMAMPRRVSNHSAMTVERAGTEVQAQPRARIRKPSTRCQGAVALAAMVAPSESATLPPRSTVRGPKRWTQSGARARATAPTR